MVTGLLLASVFGPYAFLGRILDGVGLTEPIFFVKADNAIGQL